MFLTTTYIFTQNKMNLFSYCIAEALSLHRCETTALTSTQLTYNWPLPVTH